MFKYVELITGCEEIINFALCCFVKLPLATAESIGSVITGMRGKKGFLWDQINYLQNAKIAWNGCSDFLKETSYLIDEAIEEHFKNKSGMRFFVTSKLKIISSTF